MTPQPHRLATPRDTSALTAALRGAPWIAIDTEFHTERRYAPDLYLVQLGLPDGAAWLVDPLDLTLMSEVGAALAGVDAWLVHGGENDLRLLAGVCGSVPEQVWDTQIAAGLLTTVYPASLVELAARFSGQRLDKGETLSDWSRRPLSDRQLAYAAADVQHLHTIWTTLMDQADARGRTPLIEAACAEARARALGPEDPADAWTRIGSQGLDDAEVRVLRALLRWRDAAARAEDKPARSLVGDAALRQIAAARPRTVDALLSQRRVPRSFLKGHADALLGCVAEALGAEGEPRRVIARALWPRLHALQAMAEAAGDEGAWARGLVAPDDALRQLVLLAVDVGASGACPSRSDVAAALGPWRDALAGDALDAALNGRVALRLTAAGPRLTAIP